MGFARRTVADRYLTSNDTARCSVGRMVYAQSVFNAIDDNLDGLHAKRCYSRNAKCNDDLSQVCKYRGYHAGILRNEVDFANCLITLTLGSKCAGLCGTLSVSVTQFAVNLSMSSASDCHLSGWKQCQFCGR